MKIILHIIRKEFLQFKRDPKMFVIVLFAPVIQLVFLGYAATFDVNTVHTAVYDIDKTNESRTFVERLEKSGYFRIDHYINSYDELEEHINNGEVIAGVVIPANFESDLYGGKHPKLQAIFDGSDGNTASIAAGYIQSIISTYSTEILYELYSNKGNFVIPAGTLDSETRVWYNPELKTRKFMVPGIVGLLLMLITLILTSLAIVKEKEIGTFEQLIVTPIKPYQLIIGKLVPFTIVGLIATVVVLTAMRVIFDIPVRGSVTFLFVATTIYVLSLLGFGLFVSTISKTQQQAMMLAIFIIMLPMVYLSGFAFPIENMPKSIQYVTYIVPLRYFITIIRGVILKGIGFSQLWLETSILLVMGIAILFLSSLRFKRKLD
ncbi:MAG: transport permease protein [Melioribacteraceae bacterium]|nr:MAG: transport permease protein [Melioribacteraceae bacterium]